MGGQTVDDQAKSLELPAGRACRCGSRMQVAEVSDVGEWKVVLWDCRCGRRFGAQVDPDTLEIAHTEWEATDA